MRLETELREALDRQAENLGVSRSVLLRYALTQVVDRHVLEDAARRTRLEAFRRGMEADEERLRAVFVATDHERTSELGCLTFFTSRECGRSPGAR